jgi:lysophospholipase L1-like esterase
VSFVDEGYWAKVIAAVEQYKWKYEPIVTIQFGHNDQKPGANISMPQFIANIERLAADAVQAGAIPIVVTSLTRRVFKTSTSPELVERNLLDVVVGAKTAAERGHYHLIDLNQMSTDYCNSVGTAASHKYNLDPTDTTHLNDKGSIVFGAMVAELLRWAIPWLGQYVAPDQDLIVALREVAFLLPVSADGKVTNDTDAG